MKVGDTVTYRNYDVKAEKHLKLGQQVRILNASFIGLAEVFHVAPIGGHGNFILPSSCFEELQQPLSKQSKSKKLDNLELLEWASHRIGLCQKEQFFGKLTLHFEGGKIVRTTSEKSEVPS